MKLKATSLKRLLLLAATTTALGACATTPPAPHAAKTSAVQQRPVGTVAQKDISLEKASELERAGNPLEAAAVYSRLADVASPPQRQHLRIRAMQLLLDANAAAQARRMWQETNINNAPALRNQYMLMGARISLAERDPETAQKILKSLANATNVNQAEVLRLRIEALDLLGDNQEAALARLQLGPLLTDEEEIEKNQRDILASMTRLPDDVLNRLAMTAESHATRGWVELSLLLNKSQDPVRRTGLINAWRSRFPDHPIRFNLIASLAPQQQDSPPDLSQIALLLPVQGAYAKVAEAVRDGFLAAYYQQETSDAKPVIRIYDSGTNPDNIVSIYNQAVIDGAKIAVGPLNKQTVEKLAHSGELQIPTLALNQLEDTNFYANNLYQFGLTPEDEAVQVARKAWNDGHNQAAVVFPEGAWGERVASAFIKEWETLGGMVVSQTAYPPKKNDFSASLTKLLNIDKSEQRYKKLSGLLRTKMKFETRRRQDIDFVFMAAFPRQARLIPPQLKFYHAGDLPIYATSHSYDGKIDRQADRDMNDVTIGDMPWTLQGDKASPVRRTVYETWPEGVSQYSRLYAMGVDAYNMLYYLNWLRSNPNAQLTGATGVLHMDSNNRILRELTWAKFIRGRPRVLASQSLVNTR